MAVIEEHSGILLMNFTISELIFLCKWLCEKISVNSTTVIKNDIVERLEKQPLNFFTVYNKYRNLSSFFNSQSAGVERSGMEAD